MPGWVTYRKNCCAGQFSGWKSCCLATVMRTDTFRSYRRRQSNALLSYAYSDYEQFLQVNYKKMRDYAFNKHWKRKSSGVVMVVWGSANFYCMAGRSIRYRGKRKYSVPGCWSCQMLRFLFGEYNQLENLYNMYMCCGKA